MPTPPATRSACTQPITLPPDIDPGDPFGGAAEGWWALWADGILLLLFTWIIFLGICAAAVVSWAYTAGLFAA